MRTAIEQYIVKINNIYSTGEATEHSYRGELKKLCEDVLNGGTSDFFLCKSSKDWYQLINEPKRKKYGAPDYEILKGDTAIAFIEAKNIGDSDLRGTKAKQNKGQFDKYKNAISTIAFTDYLNIILYENGEESLAACLGNVLDGRIVFADDESEVSKFEEIMRRLGKAEPQPVRRAFVLASKMANKAKLMADILRNAMKIPETDRTPEDKELWGKLNTFREFLVHDMTMEQFVDFYSQTVLYGLFIARINDKTPATFSLLEASDLIPSINPFLKKIFKELALAHLHPYVKGIVQDLVLLFKVSDINKVLRKYKKDPLIHFYEDFLAAYDPKIREQFGVWYTPKDVVGFIVNAVDHILKNSLSIENGLADNSMTDDGEWHKVQILDPATGTGTFLAETVEKIKQNYVGQEGLWGADVVDHIIPRVNGFEYLVAPYTMAHLKLATALGLDRINANIPDRLNIFLTNSLEEDHPESTLEFAQYITDESNAANKVKRDTPIMVILGNPPYNEKSANNGNWIKFLMDDYKQEPGHQKRLVGRTRDGAPKYKNTLNEQNAKGINNDYCKFIRLGHNFVNRTDSGVLAYICGNTFTKTNIFRGMRYELLRDFDDIYIINLHGSSKFDESTEDVQDENIFAIMVGVSINIFVKRSGSREGLANVHYKDVFGTRKHKLNYLKTHNLEDIDFETITPYAPFYELCPKTDDFEDLQVEYNRGFKLDKLMRASTQGFTTGNDAIIINDTLRDINRLISDIISDMTDDELIEKYGFKDSSTWKLNTARNAIKLNSNRAKYISKVCYRPFDLKYSYIHRDLMDRPRPLIQQSLLDRQNLTLCIGKQGTAMGNAEWSLAYISDLPVDKNIVPRGGAYLFPLYLYDEIGFKIYNLYQDKIEEFGKRVGLSLQSPDDKERVEGGFLGFDLIDYIYAVLHSSKYRQKYHQLLQNDFPSIPYPDNAEYFFSMAEKGNKLRNAHLLQGITPADFITQYPVSEGDNLVSSRNFVLDENGHGHVWINAIKYFAGVPKVAWDMTISGYQPLEKWLKDRNGKMLSGDEIRHFQKIVVALMRTKTIMSEIDNIIQL